MSYYFVLSLKCVVLIGRWATRGRRAVFCASVARRNTAAHTPRVHRRGRDAPATDGSGAAAPVGGCSKTQRPVSRPSPFPRHHSRKDRHVGYPSRGPVVIGVGGSISNSTGRDGRLPRRAVRPAGHQKHRRRGMRLRGSTADDLRRLAAPDEPFYGAGQPSGGQGAKVGVRLLVGCKILHAAPSCGRLSITPREFGPSLPVGRARRGRRCFGAPALNQPMTTPHLEIILDRIHND